MSLSVSYTPNYFSVEDILATQERTPCKFLCNVPKLGQLNSSSGEKDLKAGTLLELPMWLVKALSAGRAPVVQADLPKVYKEGYREILKADPCAVNLQQFGMHFYELGSHAKLFDHRGDVANILIHTFSRRFLQLMDLSCNVENDPAVLNKLDSLEKMLYSESNKAQAKMNSWLMTTGIQIEAARMVVNHKKRKRIELEELNA